MANKPEKRYELRSNRDVYKRQAYVMGKYMLLDNIKRLVKLCALSKDTMQTAAINKQPKQQVRFQYKKLSEECCEIN